MFKMVDGKLVNMTQDEIDARAAEPAPVPQDRADATVLPKEQQALLLAVAALAGKTPAQARAAFRAAMQSLS